MQYTGLTNKNDVEIYEGDIIKYVLEDGEGDIGIVKMSVNGFWIAEIKEIEDFDPLRDWLDGNIQILGNIYENTGLIEKCSCYKFGESLNTGMKCSNCGREL